MIKRLVKMTFKVDHVEDFKAMYEEVKSRIRAFPGCEHLELLQSTDDPRIFFTYSYWNDPADLEAYRHSELFQNTWAKTKQWFDDRPAAWSVQML